MNVIRDYCAKNIRHGMSLGEVALNKFSDIDVLAEMLKSRDDCMIAMIPRLRSYLRKYITRTIMDVQNGMLNGEIAIGDDHETYETYETYECKKPNGIYVSEEDVFDTVFRSKDEVGLQGRRPYVGKKKLPVHIVMAHRNYPVYMTKSGGMCIIQRTDHEDKIYQRYLTKQERREVMRLLETMK